MKSNVKSSLLLKVPPAQRRSYWSVICAASLTCGVVVNAQTNNPPATSAAATNVTTLRETTVIGQLDKSRSQILPDLGATSYNMSSAQINASSQGDNAPFNELILRAPGVAQDSAANGDLHVRGEHANLQYRINDVLLPEGITGFGLELDPRFVENLHFITGSLPAQYGFRTAGVVDIQTKSGAFENGGEGEIYGGSHDTIRPSFEFGGSTNNLNYFVDGSFEHNSLGIENPAPTSEAIHDKSEQGKLFTYMSYVLDDTSRLNFMASASYSTFQVPNTAGNTSALFTNGPTLGPQPTMMDSANLDENQIEQNYYAVLTYQKSVDDFDLQVSGIGRSSRVHFLPDVPGDLYFNGVASDVSRTLFSGGLQTDASYKLNDQHTLRAGMMFEGETVAANSYTTFYNVDPGTGDATSLGSLQDNHSLYGLFTGMYLQDEWKICEPLTLNFGGRFDVFNSSFDNENQLSPRINLIYKPTKSTTLHAGYARYFTPPPVENVPAGTVSKFNGTSNAAETDQDDPVKAESSHYFDTGISQEILPGWTVGVDGYYKRAHNQLDDGLFGQTLILSAFNYEKGEVYGTEFTTSYTHGGFATYANVAYSVARGENFNSSQFLFSQNDLNYSQNHWIYLDHDQTVSGSFGASYTFEETKKYSTLVYADALYGSGLRADGGGTEDGLPDGDPIPNGTTVPSYYTVNVGVEQRFKIGAKQMIKARLDVVNVTDNSYELRDGSGVGVNAAQYGARRGFFGSLTFVF